MNEYMCAPVPLYGWAAVLDSMHPESLDSPEGGASTGYSVSLLEDAQEED